MSTPLPHQISVLCYLFDAQGRALLLHRSRPPNRHLYSPVGGKLDRDLGESPTACAIREIGEETGLLVDPADLHLTGLVTESGYDDAKHWMMFLYEVTRPVRIEPASIAEGTLEWHELQDIQNLSIPDTDRTVIWPLFHRYRRRFFAVHIRCAGGEIAWRREQPAADATDWSELPASL